MATGFFKHQNIFETVSLRVQNATVTLMGLGVVPMGIDQSRILVEPPRDPSHGDMATNAAMVLAKDAGKKPRELAEAYAQQLRRETDLIEKVEVAGPGFINLTLKPGAWIDALRSAVRLGPNYGRSELGAGVPVNVEYVSANPTGPMHVGHCRGAVFGDTLANLLTFIGYEVTREYYINDAGAQVDQLARSAYQRYLEALGHEFAISKGLYPGDYLKPVGRHLKSLYDSKLLRQQESQWLPIVRQVAVEAMLVKILEDLDALNIEFDVFFSEKSLSEKILEYAPQVGKPTFYCASKSYDLMETPPGGIRTYLTRRAAARAGIGPATFGFSEQPPPGELRRPDFLGSTLRKLQTRDLIYLGRLPPPKGAPVEDWEDREQTLFRSTAFGDDVDRPLKKSDGSYTYFASDISYHRSKLERGFRILIDVWGADHGGYIKRMQAAVAALSDRKAELDVKVVQLVKLLRAGRPVTMSKRAGEFVTLRAVVEEVGPDAVRFMMLFRKNDAVLDFDLAKVLEQSRDNPVFYVQYGYARAQSVFRNARAAFPYLPAEISSVAEAANLSALSDPAELSLMRRIALYPRTVEAASIAHEPHRIAFYLFDLASEFHALYTLGNAAPHLRFIIQNDRQLTEARLVLVQGVATVLASGLRLLGVEAPNEMR